MLNNLLFSNMIHVTRYQGSSLVQSLGEQVSWHSACNETRGTSTSFTLQLAPYKYSINSEPAWRCRLGEWSNSTWRLLDEWGCHSGNKQGREAGCDARCCGCCWRPFLSASITFSTCLCAPLRRYPHKYTIINSILLKVPVCIHGWRSWNLSLA